MAHRRLPMRDGACATFSKDSWANARPVCEELCCDLARRVAFSDASDLMRISFLCRPHTHPTPYLRPRPAGTSSQFEPSHASAAPSTLKPYPGWPHDEMCVLQRCQSSALLSATVCLFRPASQLLPNSNLLGVYTVGWPGNIVSRELAEGSGQALLLRSGAIYAAGIDVGT